MNLPNVLTLSRIFFAGLLVLLLERNSLAGYVFAAIVFAVASLTDLCDGHLAKSRGLVSDFGKIMDPVADKILLLSAFGVLAHIGMISGWMFAVIAIREILVTFSRLMAMKEGRILAAERTGKIKTAVQIMAVSVILLYLVAQRCEFLGSWFSNSQGIWLDLNYGLMLAAVILTVYSGIDYFLNHSSK
jgi:CDP-diacylglycerol--glycerol-3-phosphate 3-phosphatidyltransferase